MRTSRSSSTSSNTSSPSENTHHIFVKLLSGETIPLTIPSNTPLQHLQHLLSLRTSAPPPSIRLTYAGRHLTSPPATATTTTTTTPPSTPPSSIITTTTTTTLSALPQNALLHLSLPLLGGTPPNSTPSSTTTTSTLPPNPRRKQKCTFKDCKTPAQRIVGDCSFCAGHFCGNHRMLEDHKCTGLEDCKAEAHERNREVLEGGKTVVVRGI